jgi:hypothetical protein
MFFILVLALVLALVRYLVMVLVDLLAQNDHSEQTDSLITIFAVFRDKFSAFIQFFLERLTMTR